MKKNGFTQPQFYPAPVFLKTGAGFTLIELLIVIAVIATIIAFAVPNFLGARQRANDTRKKAEMIQLKNALRLYYNDYNKYPADNAPGPLYTVIKGCGAAGDAACSTTGGEFSAGVTIYMRKLPYYTTGTMFYYQIDSGDNFCLKANLENLSDPDIANSQSRCATPCSGKLSTTDFAVCAD